MTCILYKTQAHVGRIVVAYVEKVNCASYMLDMAVKPELQCCIGEVLCDLHTSNTHTDARRMKVAYVENST